jgi:hypothetical protein
MLGGADILRRATLSSTCCSAFCVSMGLACSAFNTAGWLMTFIDVAPAYASIVYSFSNMIAALPGIVSSTIAGAVIEKTGSLSSVFGFAGVVDVERCSRVIVTAISFSGVMWGVGGTIWLLRLEHKVCL